jgi:hypothetical protein
MNEYKQLALSVMLKSKLESTSTYGNMYKVGNKDPLAKDYQVVIVASDFVSGSKLPTRSGSPVDSTTSVGLFTLLSKNKVNFNLIKSITNIGNGKLAISCTKSYCELLKMTLEEVNPKATIELVVGK